MTQEGILGMAQGGNDRDGIEGTAQDDIGGNAQEGGEARSG